MSDIEREAFEKWFKDKGGKLDIPAAPLPDLVKAIAWEGYKAARTQGEEEAVTVFSGLSTFELKAVAMEIHRVAGEVSDGEDDYPVDLVYCPTLTGDDGKVQEGPFICVRDGDYPEEGVWPITVSQQVRDRYTHPSAGAVPEAANEEMLSEGAEALIRAMKAFPGNLTQIVSNIWEDMYAAAPTAPVDSEPVAWMNLDNPREVISDIKKHAMERSYGIGGRQLLSYCSVPLYTHPHNGEQGGEWVRCDERLPTEADAGDLEQVWLCSPIEAVWLVDYRSVRPGLFPVHEGGWYWMPTGLKCPAPPTEREGE